ncbi:hypothetical protein [Halosimplex pelagicum]|uniref:Uncharacterized protein n=1 Tax=Halosimplex pelagicum TaxID=869886 RepID=A0A7D5TUB0_9EURY|nr:hypothetical protein [Halosimplex pelagicum]QLH82174.1 hypothetical protein HZS54_11400 [Halosimplex pelagicum]
MDILPSGDDIASKIWDLLFGSIAEAIESAVDAFLGFGIEVFFTVENPYGDTAAFQAWMDSFEIALAIFPIMIILGLLSMPFADEQKTSLWRQGLRAVGVIVLIALSRPLIGFGVDLANILTHALMPSGGDLLNLMNPLNQMGNAIGLGLVYVLLGTKFFALAAIAMLITLLLLQFRTFMIYVVYIMSPLLAVFWYADWGLLESIHEFANKFARMGIYSLLVGPIVAVIYRTLLVIGLSGFSAGFGSAQWVSAIWSQLVLTLLLPFLLIATVWKLISWAGEPLGVGNAITGALVAAGAAITAGMGGLAGMAGGAGGGAGGSAGAGGAAGAGGGAGAGGAAGAGGGAGAGPSASSMAQSAGGGGGSVGTGSSSSGGVGASGSATTANGGSLSDVVDEGQTVSASESEPAGGVSSGPGGGTGEPGGGPSDSATGVDESPSEPKGYVEGASERMQDWKSRNAQRIKDTANKGYEGAKDRLNPTNIQRRQAQKHMDAAEGLQENKKQFNDSINWNDGEHGTVDLQQANEAGALNTNPAESQDTAQLTEDGQFTYRGEDGETHRTSVGTTRGQFDESIEQHQQKAEQHEQRADSIDETLSKQESRMKKTAQNQRKRQQAAGNAFYGEGMRGSIGAHSPYLMQGSGDGYGGNTVGGETGGSSGGGGSSGVPNANSQPAEDDSGGGIERPEHSVQPEFAEKHSDMLSDTGERFDLDREVGYEPSAGSTPEGVSQQGKLVAPETGQEIGDVEVAEDADFSLSQDETARLGNVRMRKGEDGSQKFHVDGNSRQFEEGEVRGDEIIGNDEIAGNEATVKNATLREAPSEAENYEDQFYAETENGEVIPVNAEDEETAQHLQENVGETGTLTGDVSREYGMSEDAHESHQGAHEYNALNVSSSSESEAGAGEGADSNGAGGVGGSGSSGGSESSESAQTNSGFGLYDEGGASEPDSESPVNNTLSPTRLNRGEANPTINNDRSVEGKVIQDPEQGHALKDESTGETLNARDIDDPNNNITSDEGEFVGDIETGEQARVENVRVGADGNSIEATEASEVTTPTAEKTGSESDSGTGTEDGESVSGEGGDSGHEGGDGGQINTSHGFSTADNGSGTSGSSDGSNRSSTTSTSSSGHGFESASNESSPSSSSDSESGSSSGPDTVSGEKLARADNSQEDLPYKTSPEGQWVYEDTWNEDEIEQDMYDGSDASADDMIAARGVLHEADENGNVKEDGASVGYVRFGSEHGLDESPAPEIDGERRDPQDGETVEFDEESGVKTRQWATEEGFNYADSRVQESSGIEHGGEEGAVTRFEDGEEVSADPDNQYIQVVPDEDSQLSSAGTAESAGGPSSETASPESAPSETPGGDLARGSEDVGIGSEESETEGVTGSTELEGGRVQHENLEGVESREDLDGETADIEGTVGTNEYGDPTIESEDGSAPLTDTTQTGAPELGSGQLENVSEGDSISASNAQIETGSENDTISLSEESEVSTQENHEGGVSVDFSGSESQSEAEAGSGSTPEDSSPEPEATGSSPAEGGHTDDSSTVVDDTVSGSISTPEDESGEATVEKGESEESSVSESAEGGSDTGSEAESGESGSSSSDDPFADLAEESDGWEDDPFIDTSSESGTEGTGPSGPTESTEMSASESQTTEEPTEDIGSTANEPEESGSEGSSLDIGEGGSQQSPEIEDNEPEVEKEPEDVGGKVEEPEPEPEGESAEGGSNEGASQSEIDESIGEVDLDEGEASTETTPEQEGGLESGSEPESSEGSDASFEGDPFEDISTDAGGEEATTSESSGSVEHDQEVHQEGGEYESGDFESGDIELGDREDGDFETGDVEQRESHEEAGGGTPSHDAGAEQNIDPETGAESEVVEESEEQQEEPEEAEEDGDESEGNSDDEDGDDDGGSGGVAASGGDDHDGGGSGNESAGGESSTSAERSATTSSESGSSHEDGEEAATGGSETETATSGGKAEAAGDEETEGGWEERARNWREHTDESESNGETVDENAGFTAEAMEVETLEDGEQVFITDYDELDETMDDGDIMNTLNAEELRHRSLAGQQWTEEMEQEPPNTAFNEENNEIIQQEAGGAETETWAVDEAPDEALEKVDREEYEETMAVQMLGGNIDVSEDNVHVDEEGGLHVIDFDRSGAQMGKFDDAREMEISAGAAGRVGEEIGEANEDFHEDSRKYEGEITNKATEIATELEEEGRTDEVLEPVEDIDEEHSEHSDGVAPVIRHNIESVSNDSVEVESTSGASQDELDEVFGNLEEGEGDEGEEATEETEEEENSESE